VKDLIIIVALTVAFFTFLPLALLLIVFAAKDDL
jgi:hypothetical protein